MSRECLPNRRCGETFAFQHGGREYIATIGYYPDGRIGEIFATGGKTGTDLAIETTDAAIASSLALQFGAPVATLRQAFLRNESGGPAGAMAALFDRLLP